MYNSLQLSKKYIQYYVSASNSRGHGTHSPFVFDFIRHVLNNGKAYRMPDHIEMLRSELRTSKEIMTIEDLGAGSRTGSGKTKTVGELLSTAVKPKKYGQLLYRLALHYHPASIIELGTSLGLTTAYLASAHNDITVTTIEGSGEVHLKAMENFKHLGLENIKAWKGNFDDILPRVLADAPCVDLAYIDGNHRYEPTINYFNQFIVRRHNFTILVFDDIHWSPEMESAWEQIKTHPEVRCTIDIFFLGFVFFRNEFKEKQHFTIRY